MRFCEVARLCALAVVVAPRVMAAARPSAYNTEIRVFILVLRRRRPLFSFPAGEVAGATRVVASTGLGEWHTPCRGSRIVPARLLNLLASATCADTPVS